MTLSIPKRLRQREGRIPHGSRHASLTLVIPQFSDVHNDFARIWDGRFRPVFLFHRSLFLSAAQRKETHANISNVKTDSKSHISRTGSSSIFDNITLITTKNGTANKKVVPKATDFRVLPRRLKTAAIIHRKTQEATATTPPTENTSFTFIKLASKNK